nr:MAG TPA: hypothetical protein [Caudoviricetes sp.]
MHFMYIPENKVNNPGVDLRISKGNIMFAIR